MSDEQDMEDAAANPGVLVHFNGKPTPQPDMTREVHLAWQLALKGQFEPNPDWSDWFDEDPRMRDMPKLLRVPLRLHNGTVEGEYLYGYGSTTNEAYRDLRDKLLTKEF